MTTSNKDLPPIDINSTPQFKLAVRIVNKELEMNLDERDFHGDIYEKTHQLCEEIRNKVDIKGGFSLTKSPQAFKTINLKLKEETLSPDDIKTYFNDDRFCNFCWSLLYISKRRRTEPFPTVNHDYEISLIKKLSDDLMINGLNIKQRKNNLINCIQNSNTTINEKMDVINIFNSIWISSVGKEVSLEWVDRNNINDCRWCYEYMINSKILDEIFKPTEHDYFWALTAAIDLAIEPNKIELTMLKMKKSFSQRKYREKHPELKAYSIKMAKETKDKLDKIAIKSDKKIHEIIEKLINQEYHSLV